MLNVSNFLSIVRIILIIPMSFALINEYLTLALIIAILAYITDLLDGYLARKLNQITELGKILDPLADKMMLASIVIILLYQSKIPFWFGAVLIGRDLLILLGGLMIKNKIKYVPASNLIGKITIDVIGITLVGIVFNIPYFDIYGPVVSTIFVIISLFVYFVNNLKLIKNENT
ncbi:MAG: CDP-alcohol phosphatidyltransferase family protein [Candidatus Kapabacteria bacterium]|nr:CDP-alcohol phosphatidyltransferase family protein [Candidatus Kapabacteria bacterium]